MTILVCAFKANSKRSLSYRQYKSTLSAVKEVHRILFATEADYISIRIVREEKCLSPIAPTTA